MKGKLLEDSVGLKELVSCRGLSDSARGEGSEARRESTSGGEEHRHLSHSLLTLELLFCPFPFLSSMGVYKMKIVTFYYRL